MYRSSAAGQRIAPSAAGRCGLAAVLLAAVLATGSRAGRAADGWGGSIDVTSDYVVRGISRSDDNAAAQFDVHYLDASGFLAALFASSAQIDPKRPGDAEIDGYLGYVWTASADWRAKLVGGYYAYTRSADGARYDYAEIDADVSYRRWLNVAASYFPDAPRYLPSGALIRVSAGAAELSLQRPLLGRLSGTAGIGYYEISGPHSTGYAYWSAGAAYDVSAVSLAASFVKAGSGADTLFYDAETRGRWIGTVIWRFR